MPFAEHTTSQSGDDSSFVDAKDERTRILVLRVMVWTFVGLTSLVAPLSLALHFPGEAAISSAGGSVQALILATRRRIGPRRPGILCTIWYFVLATATIAEGKGVNDVTMVLFPAGMFLGAVLLDRKFLLPPVGVSVVIAEGVEDEPTVDALRAMGCDMAQGYFFAHPAPAQQFGRQLREGGPWHIENPNA